MAAMQYRLALDLGTTSIGWAVLRLDQNNNPCAIVKLGSRIFSDGRHPKTGTSLAVERRLARQMRRRRDRLLKRKRSMLDALVTFGFLPQDDEARKALTVLDPYELRAKGLDKTLSGPEFGRALLHINQRRGFKSNRKTDSKDNEGGALKSAIKKLRETLDAEGYRTLGEWLNARHVKGDHVRARLSGNTIKDRAYNFYADRGMIEHEFDTLWAKQAEHNPKLFSVAAHDKLKDILLFQRKLKPVLPGRCTLEPELHRAPLALPSTQRFRILQELNNLRIVNLDLNETPLTLEQRNIAADALEKSKDVTFNKLRNHILKLPSDTKFNLEDLKRDRLKGNLTSFSLANKKALGDTWHELSLAQQDEIVTELLRQESEQELRAWLSVNLEVDADTALALSNASLPDGYGSLSKEALAQVLPHLEKTVITYDKAVLAAGYESHSQLAYGETTGEILLELPYYGIPLKRYVAFEKPDPKNDEEKYGKIANPTVHIGLNQIRVVVNALIKRYGLPAEVHIEVARDLKLSRERKLEIQKDQKKRQDRNKDLLEKACQILSETAEHLSRTRRRALSQKMQLWTELNPDDCADRRCPFSGKQISIHQLLSDEVEIEHILPFSQTLDDGMNNKTVAFREANRLKGNKSPFEAFGDDIYAERGYVYSDILLRANKMRNNPKTKRFAADAMEQWRGENDFLARAITDTAYLARVAKQYLSCVCPHNKVVTVPGRLTALLRGHYGLNQLLSGNAHKNRDDHRHHAIDAAIIGITDRSLLQKVATANANTKQQQLNKLIDDMPQPWPTFRQQVAQAVDHIWVSHKPDHGYQGRMHEETAWGFAPNGKATMRKRNENNQRERVYENKKLIPISESSSTRHGLTDEGQAKAYKGYVGGSNYCLEICLNEKKQWKGTVVTTFQAYQAVREFGESNALKRLRSHEFSFSGLPLVMRVMIGDMLQLTINEEKQIYRICKIDPSGNLCMAKLHEANISERTRNKDIKYFNKTAGSLQKARVRLVTCSPIGKISIQN